MFVLSTHRVKFVEPNTAADQSPLTPPTPALTFALKMWSNLSPSLNVCAHDTSPSYEVDTFLATVYTLLSPKEKTASEEGETRASTPLVVYTS